MVPQYKTILYATDLTTNSAFALRHAVSIAHKYDADIHLLHVLPEADAAVVNYVATVMGQEKLADFERQHHAEVADDIRQRMEKFAAEELNENATDIKRIKSIDVHHGNPVAEVLKAADKIEADLIVIGSHGKGMLSYAFLGSVAEKLLRKCHRPVMVVPLQKS